MVHNAHIIHPHPALGRTLIAATGCCCCISHRLRSYLPDESMWLDAWDPGGLSGPPADWWVFGCFSCFSSSFSSPFPFPFPFPFPSFRCESYLLSCTGWRRRTVTTALASLGSASGAELQGWRIWLRFRHWCLDCFPAPSHLSRDESRAHTHISSVRIYRKLSCHYLIVC